ncbi:MAG: hypothetical protein COV74_08820 [Candidatus Omnitrophica bacterium CG11_big_fil_rev_8_21_14_0_20_45_26]|uniref:Polymerase/histidinol phosphatase N-terminal domain-containing protein n=1 Tax=Candidatus Abzuiibacterium crystallinum TaxID=1974748 RepID=A0A2H0LM41_9BACT|nr:MAG: hypothetical protein COV74_08820 [Candidatus Omnitrophica bacterium CG11_big_fil_rev_8_21_14_0_20_45_26]PIW64419.1 MAG: hypothetical protein COW12_06165 [Candidatus Omnitrophica bacterium CG12_big_fil_rev_8_21_14_0_65_45_16]
MISKNKLVLLLLLGVMLQACSTMPRAPKIPNLVGSADAPGVYRGVFHVHTKYSHDSKGTIKQVIKAARGRKLDFVVITDHNNMAAKKDPEIHARKPLLMVGNEISTTDGHLIALGTRETISTPVEPKKAIQLIHQQDGFAVLAHPVCNRTAWQDWNVNDFDGMEVYNQACDVYAANKAVFFFQSLLLPPSLFARYAVLEPRDALVKWDQILEKRLVPAYGAADAHVRYRVLGFPLMRYSLSFRAVTMYVMAKQFSKADILRSLRHGESYLVFESMGRAEDFHFAAKVGEVLFPMGSQTTFAGKPFGLRIKVPKKAVIRLYRNGEALVESEEKDLQVDQPGAGIYRVEVFRDGKLWIVSNPIRLEA